MLIICHGRASQILQPRSPQKLTVHGRGKALTNDYSAAWHGARIILRQVSEEAVGIFDFILELYASCSGCWTNLLGRCSITREELDGFLGYAATFLSNLGNYYVFLYHSLAPVALCATQ